MRTRCCPISIVLLLVAVAGSARAEDRATDNGGYAEAAAGPAFATYLPVDPGAPDEHFATSGTQVLAGAGYGWRLRSLRFDLGLRLQYQALSVAGRYDANVRDDAFRARYTFIAPLVYAGLTTQLTSRVDATFGASLGSATHLSERQGARLSVEQIPIFGSIELGFAVALSPWLEARVLVAWQPPLGGANVLVPEAGFRARF